MRWPMLTACLWPGLRQLWICSNWLGLAQAFGFALLLNWALIISFLWTDWATSAVQTIVWVAVGVLWTISGLTSGMWGNGSAAAGTDADTDATFAVAQCEYLQGNWFSAETTLRSMVRRNANDEDAQLMLATLLRHTGRLEEAHRALQRLLRTDGNGKWNLEIKSELERLAEALADRDVAEGDAAEGSDQDSLAVGFDASPPERWAEHQKAASEARAADAA